MNWGARHPQGWRTITRIDDQQRPLVSGARNKLLNEANERFSQGNWTGPPSRSAKCLSSGRVFDGTNNRLYTAPPSAQSPTTADGL